MKAYHFLKGTMTAGYGNEPPWVVGEKRTIGKHEKAVLCEHGYHSSPSWRDALQYTPGLVACIVEVSRPSQKDASKQVSRSRKLIAAQNVERELRLFDCDCAERVLPNFEKMSNDPAPRKAIEVARLYANGKATADELAAAWSAAESAAAAAASAAESAARSAAESAAESAASAARSAAASVAASAAASAAWSAAESAAASAAASAAESAAESAASAASAAESAWLVAWSAEIKWQQERLAWYLDKVFTEATQ